MIHLLYGVHFQTEHAACSAPSAEIRCSRSACESSPTDGIPRCRWRRRAHGLRTLEIPVPCRRRIGGASKVSGNLSGTLRAGTRIVSTIARIASERDPGRDARMRERDA